MGNAFSCQGCCPCLFTKKPNLPTKVETEDRPKPVTPVYGENDATVVEEDFLSIKSWDLCVKENGASHHTADYDIMERENPGLVVRRGQEFAIVLNTNRAYDKEKDKIGLVFRVKECKKPNYGNGTMVGVGVGVEKAEGGWSASIDSFTDNSIRLKVVMGAGAVVGEWRVEADVQSCGKTHMHPCTTQLFLLFNPWCEDDQVYMADPDHRQEYVVSDSGLIWRGTTQRHRPCPWNFAQYEKDVLPCILYVLAHTCKMAAANRGNAVKVARALSAGINSPDDNGVLVGNWSGEYEGGTSPTKWGGSQLILQQYWEKKSPVKYGQCWVFSGVLTSACRALGLPCRPITNFSSAHDTHNSLTIDYFFDDEGEAMERLNSDSIWNFHVWNEVWTKRPDLGEAYDGWQCIDATPQEESDGQYRCGPASLNAIKLGHIQRPYDVGFVFAEVNADKLFWKYRGPSQPMKLLGRKTQGVGQFISTKAVGKYAREDVTDLYKHKDESTEERDVMRNALRMCENNFARYYLNEELEDVEFDFQLLDDIVIGQPFRCMVEVHNKGSEEHEVEVLLRADTTLYTGQLVDLVKKHKETRTIKPGLKDSFEMSVSFDEYYPKLADQCSFNLACLATVAKTSFEYFAQDDFRCRKPDIKIEVCGEPRVGKELCCTASFTNPLPLALTKPRFIVQGAGLTKVQFIKPKESVGAGSEARCEFRLTPTLSGERTVNVMFDSKQLEDVDGHTQLTVAAKEDTAINGATEDLAANGGTALDDGIPMADVDAEEE